MTRKSGCVGLHCLCFRSCKFFFISSKTLDYITITLYNCYSIDHQRRYVDDEETALYYLRSRYHNPCHTRFINVDNHLGVICRLISHTAFTYCRNSPILYLDYAGTEETRFNCPQCRYMPQNEEFHYHVPSAIVSYDMSDYTLAHVTGDDVNVRNANCETTNMVTNTGDQWYVKIPDPSTYAGTSFVEVLITEGTARYARTGHISISFLFIPSTRLGYAHGNDSGRAGEINIRSSPEISKSNILRTIQNGQAAYIHAAIGGWYLISNEEGSGWVSSDYFTEIVASARSPQLTNCITSRFAMVCIY